MQDFFMQKAVHGFGVKSSVWFWCKKLCILEEKSVQDFSVKKLCRVLVQKDELGIGVKTYARFWCKNLCRHLM